MKILLTGSQGQLGQALKLSVPKHYELIALTRKDLDLSNSLACKELIESLRPDWVLNAGAYTAVDKAESESELAKAVNADAPKVFAQVLSNIGGRILQISTDYVFNGQQGFPYKVDQELSPLGVYGATKAAGEEAVQKWLGDNAFVIRASWLYGPVGNNFLRTMLALHQAKVEQGESIDVIADQVGCPTSTSSLASACWKLIERANDSMYELIPNIYHWSDAGVASWYDFAFSIGHLGASLGLLEKPALVKPLRTVDYPTNAQRPSYSLLDCSLARSVLQIEPLHWTTSLRDVLSNLKNL